MDEGRVPLGHLPAFTPSRFSVPPVTNDAAVEHVNVVPGEPTAAGSLPWITAWVCRAVNPMMSYFSLPDGEVIILVGSFTGKKRIFPTSPASASYQDEVLW